MWLSVIALIRTISDTINAVRVLPELVGVVA
jgi:hypothetical protein